MPEHTWVVAGENELFSADIARWVEIARGRGARVEAEVWEGCCHDAVVFESFWGGGCGVVGECWGGGG